MTKYSFKFKLKIIHNYLSGQGGAPFLAKKYEFKNSSQIRKWINVYLKELSRLYLDNSPQENFFSILKQELYYGKVYQSQNELRLAIENYIYYYNHYRIKEKLNWKCSVEFRVFNQKTA
ncbi:IS3 family transposase [Listeria innocua]|nr:IS3 family transposase [Listeria innocua]MBC2137626.1 IS3 family transposase [Listeria innocua]